MGLSLCGVRPGLTPFYGHSLHSQAVENDAHPIGLKQAIFFWKTIQRPDILPKFGQTGRVDFNAIGFTTDVVTFANVHPNYGFLGFLP